MNPSSESTTGSLSGPGELRVLLFNVPRANLDPDTCFLSRAPFSVESYAKAEEMMPRLDKTAFKMVILNLPFGGFEPRDIIYTLRHQNRPSSHAILVVLAPDDKIAEYQSYLTKGVSALFPLSAPAANLETALAAILQVAPRVETRVMVRLSAKVHQLASKHLCQALNLSRTGMFVATTLDLPTGSEVTFELLLPNHPAPLVGEARVARQTKGMGSRTNGLGLSFASFKTDGRARLEAFLKSIPPKR